MYTCSFLKNAKLPRGHLLRPRSVMFLRGSSEGAQGSVGSKEGLSGTRGKDAHKGIIID